MQDNNATTSNSSESLYYKVPMPFKATLLSVEVAIALVGVVGNLLVCIVITKRANMKTTMNLYLRNLAIADLGVLLVNFPLIVKSVFSKTFFFGRFFCLYVYPSTDIFFGASIWSITIIAIERYKNIISCRSFGKRAESSKKITLKILVIWVVSFLVVALPMYPIMKFEEKGVTSYCYPAWPEDYILLKCYVSVMTIFWYLLPMAIIIVTYSKISSKLKQSTVFHKGMHGDNAAKSNIIKEEEKRRLKQNKKAKRILTPLVLVFAITMLPVNIFRMVTAFSPSFLASHYTYVYFNLCTLFFVINSAVDPLVYYISSKEFRKVLQPMLNCSPRSSREESAQLKASQTTPKTQREGLLVTPPQEIAHI